MSSASDNDEDAFLAAMAKNTASTVAPKQSAKSKGKSAKGAAAGGTSAGTGANTSKSAATKGRGKATTAAAKEDASADVSDEDLTATSTSSASKSKQPQLTQYESWKAKQQKSSKKSNTGGDESDEEEEDTKKPQHQQPASRAPREAKPARVPIKVERAKATRQADIDSGVASALRELAMKKKQAKKMKKLKAKAVRKEGDEDDDDDDEDEEDDADDATSDNDSSAPAASASSAQCKLPRSSASSDADDHDDEQSESATSSAQQPESDEHLTLEDRVASYRETHTIHLHSLDESIITSQDLDSDQLLFPALTFDSLVSEFGLDQALVTAATGSYATPTPIQAQCWPMLLSGKDVIGVASTGSGKSIAFLLPAVFYIMQVRAREAKKAAKEAAVGVIPAATPATTELTPRVLILAPTRELAIQIHTVAKEITTKLSPNASASSSSSSSTAASSSSPLASPITTYVIFGGTSLDAQLSSLRSLPSLDLLVSTPGRCVKHLKENSILLKKVGYFVLDEADRMLDCGFEDDLQVINEQIPKNRQSALFSATWEESAQKTADTFLKRGAEKTVKVVIGSEDLQAAKSVTQIVEVVDRRQGKREKRLLELLQQYHSTRTNRVLIFVLYKKEAGLLADHLKRHGWKANAISGDLAQSQRVEALEKFRSGEVPILVATDVAARGLDVKNVTHVINFSLGLSVEQYIHRVGRCGRAGTTGVAHTFVVDYDAPHTPALVKVLRDGGYQISDELLEMSERAERQAAKHTSDPHSELKGDAYFVSLKAGQLTKNVNLAKKLQKEQEDAEIQRKIFGDDAEDELVQGPAGKKHHAAGAGGKKHHGGPKKGGGKRH